MKLVKIKNNIVYRGLDMHVSSVIKNSDLQGMLVTLTETIPYSLLGYTIELKRKRYFHKPFKKNVLGKTINLVGVDGDYANMWMSLKSKIEVYSDIEPLSVLDNRSDISKFLNFIFKFNK